PDYFDCLFHGPCFLGSRNALRRRCAKRLKGNLVVVLVRRIVIPGIVAVAGRVASITRLRASTTTGCPALASSVSATAQELHVLGDDVRRPPIDTLLVGVLLGLDPAL